MNQIKNLKMYDKMMIVVDMVNGFVREGVLHDETIARIIPRQVELVKKALLDGTLVVFIKDVHEPDAVEFHRFGNTKHCVRGTSEAEVVEELKPFLTSSLIFEKNSTSFFTSDNFIDTLDKLKNLKQVEVMGCCTDICIMNGVLPMMNYFDQKNKTVRVVVHEDAIETYQGPGHNRETYTSAAKLLMAQQGVQFVKKI